MTIGRGNTPPNKQIILVRNTDTREIVHSEAFDKVDLSPQKLADITTNKVVELEDRYQGSNYQVIDGSGKSVDDFLSNYPQYRPQNWRPGQGIG